MLCALLLMGGYAQSSSAQALPKHSLSFHAGEATLTGGDIGGFAGRLAYGYSVHPRLELSARAGGVLSVRRGLDGFGERFTQHDREAWRDRRHAHADVVAQFALSRFPVGQTQHAFSVGLGPSYRYRAEERMLSLFFVTASSLTPAERERLDADCASSPRGYCGEAVGPDGTDRFYMETGKSSDTDLGLVGTVGYSVVFTHFLARLEAGYYRYVDQRINEGSHLMYLSLGAGYRF